MIKAAAGNTANLFIQWQGSPLLSEEKSPLEQIRLVYEGAKSTMAICPNSKYTPISTLHRVFKVNENDTKGAPGLKLAVEKLEGLVLMIKFQDNAEEFLPLQVPKITPGQEYELVITSTEKEIHAHIQIKGAQQKVVQHPPSVQNHSNTIEKERLIEAALLIQEGRLEEARDLFTEEELQKLQELQESFMSMNLNQNNGF